MTDYDKEELKKEEAFELYCNNNCNNFYLFWLLSIKPIKVCEQ